MAMTIWLRNETKINEKRTPLTPTDAKKILQAGHRVVVEKSIDRSFNDQDYLSAGCEMVATNSWITDAPSDAFILGLKELETKDFPLTHNHIYFAHIYKGQEGHQQVFSRFKKGHGTLFDLEFLMNEKGARVAAFGYWAGYVGAALAVECFTHQDRGEKMPALKWYSSKQEWVKILQKKLEHSKKPQSIIIGALGRCGKGARDLLASLNLQCTPWDFEETKKGGPFKDIVQHDIFINTVLMAKKIPPFLDHKTLEKPNKLKIVADISCDPYSELNPIPIYNTHTTWENPTTKISDQLELIAVDNLPSALPKESSEDFSNQLIDHLLNLCNVGLDDYVWSNAKEIFNERKQS